MVKYYFLFLILFSSINMSSSNEEISDKKLNDRKSILSQKLKELFPEDEPGAACIIMQNEEIIFEEYFGLSFLPNGPKIDKDTTFNIASVSKQFTAVGILQLVEEGRLSLDESMSLLFPEYTDPIWVKIKLKHLLSHSSGIPDERGYLPREKRIYGDDNLALEYLSKLDHLDFEPGSYYEYMNPTYVLLGRLIERISQKPFTEYMQEKIFNQAGMNQTYYIGNEKNKCHAYEYDRDKGRGEEPSGNRTEGPHDWYEYDYGEETFFGTRPDGGIFTTPRDFIKWELNRPKLLKEELLNEAYTPHIQVYGSPYSDYQNRKDTYYGYGWFIEPKKNCIYHTGDNGGFKILASRYPKKNAFVLVFAARTDWDRYELKSQIEKLYSLLD